MKCNTKNDIISGNLYQIRLALWRCIIENPEFTIHNLHMQVRIARIFNTYGPRMCLDDGRVVSNFVAQVCRLSLF